MLQMSTRNRKALGDLVQVEVIQRVLECAAHEELPVRQAACALLIRLLATKSAKLISVSLDGLPRLAPLLRDSDAQVRLDTTRCIMHMTILLNAKEAACRASVDCPAAVELLLDIAASDAQQESGASVVSALVALQNIMEHPLPKEKHMHRAIAAGEAAKKRPDAAVQRQAQEFLAHMKYKP